MLLDLFNTCATGSGYNQTRGKVDWKLIDGIMYFRQSVECEDWFRNILAVIPFPVYLKGWQLVPLGAWLTYRQVRKVAKSAVRGYVGSSQGGWPDAYASLENGLPATVFGCPAATTRPELYKNVRAYQNKGDPVPLLPPWAQGAGIKTVLDGDNPSGAIGWEHSPGAYRQRLGTL